MISVLSVLSMLLFWKDSIIIKPKKIKKFHLTSTTLLIQLKKRFLGKGTLKLQARSVKRLKKVTLISSFTTLPIPLLMMTNVVFKRKINQQNLLTIPVWLSIQLNNSMPVRFTTRKKSKLLFKPTKENLRMNNLP